MPSPVTHHHALGIHPGAFVQPTTPNTADVQDGVLWLDTSAGPPYQLKRWDAVDAAWRVVQMDATGYPLPGGHRLDVVSRAAIEAATANFGTSGPDSYALEHVIPRGDLTLADFTGDLIVDWSMFAWDQVEDAGPYHIVVRLRRSELHGELLDSHVFTAPTSQHPIFGVGLQNQYSWTAVYNDNAPTDGHYVITLQKLVHADIAMINQDPYLRIRESVPVTQRVRISHATLGSQMVWPIPVMSQPATVMLAKDDASGLPMWAQLNWPATEADVLPRTPPWKQIPTSDEPARHTDDFQPTDVSGWPPSTSTPCDRQRCGAAHAIAEGLYTKWTLLFGFLAWYVVKKVPNTVDMWWYKLVNTLIDIKAPRWVTTALITIVEPSAAASLGTTSPLRIFTNVQIKANLQSLDLEAIPILAQMLYPHLRCVNNVVVFDPIDIFHWGEAIWAADDEFTLLQRSLLVAVLTNIDFMPWAYTAAMVGVVPRDDCGGW